MNALLIAKLTLSLLDATILDLTFEDKAVAEHINKIESKEYSTIIDLKYSNEQTLCNNLHIGDYINWTSPKSTTECYLNLIKTN